MNALLVLALLVGQHAGHHGNTAAPGLGTDGGDIGTDASIGDCIHVDENGANGCTRSSDAAPGAVLFTGQNAYSQAASNKNGADVLLGAGMASKTVTIDDYNNCGTDTVTVTIDGSANVLTEASEWTAATSNAATATSLASAIDALSGLSATASAAVVYVTKDNTISLATLSEGDATCTTVANNTNGTIKSYYPLDAQGAFTVATFTLDQYVSAGSAALGPTAPTSAENASCGGKMFDADNESVHFRYHVPGCWTAASDITLKVEWCNENGDAVADTETVKFDFEFRSIIWGTEGADNGSAVVITATYTQSGAGGAADTHETALTIDYDGATQPVSAGDVIVGHFDRDVTGDTYSGGAIIAGWEFSVQCNAIPDHGN